MDKKPNQEKELLRVMTSENVHNDELVKEKDCDWSSFFKNDNTVDENFMNDRDDVIEIPLKSIFDDS